MTWNRFVSVLPVLTLVLGYVGSLHTERWREERSRSRQAVDRVLELEREALIEIQDILDTFAGDWIGVLRSYNASLESGEEWSWVAAGGATGARRNRALSRISRIIDTDLRRQLLDLIIYEIGDDLAVLYAQMDRREPVEIRFWDRWQATDKANALVAHVLRSPRIDAGMSA